jgi:hypothetical protein
MRNIKHPVSHPGKVEMKRLTVALLTAVLLGITTPASAAPAAIFTASSTGQRGHIDPIVSPGATWHMNIASTAPWGSR